MAKKNIVEVGHIVVKFAGDSGDGMQLTGTQFSDSSAIEGDDLSTFPDYPAEIRAPQGTLAGVSGFQIHIGQQDITTPGDQADVLVAMNPAALKKNIQWLKTGAMVIIDIDNFDDKNYKKAGFIEDPLEDGTLDGFNVVKAPITELTRATVKEIGLDNKIADKIKNQFVSGMLFWLFNRKLEIGITFLRNKFKKKPDILQANIDVINAGYNYAETIEAFATTFMINPIKKKKGLFRNIQGNIATAWGLMAAAEKANKELFLGSYPITPASDILQELSKYKNLGVITFQAEDEIAGVSSAIGASYTGRLAATSTSGPGLALKGEAIGLAVMTELPLVIVNVQRGGPSTGLPTKTEQSDLNQALYGRNGESPCVIIAASTPANCFDFAFMASKIAIEHMTPVILLSDGYLANGSELWNLPNTKDLPDINVPSVKDNDTNYKPYRRNPETLSRYWAIPGQKGLRHRIGGLEKEDVSGEVSYDPYNHQLMTNLREMKVQKVADYIPALEVEGDKKGKVLVVGWGGTYGALHTAVKELQKEGKNVGLAQFNYIKPLPKNTDEVFNNFSKIIVCELNMGQFINYLRGALPNHDYYKYNKYQGLPFMINELKNHINQMLEEI